MIKKIAFFLCIVIISVITASVYGFLHNQVSFSISPEYFTMFKFQQFHFYFMGQHQPRLTAALIGVLSTWWLGLFIELIIGIFGFLQSSPRIMWKSSLRAIQWVFIITIGTGIIGVLVGKLIISNLHTFWELPFNVVKPKRFLIAGTLHNFSYLGGLIGLIYGIIYQLKIKKLNTK